MCKCGPTFCKGLFIIVNTFLLVIAIVLSATAGYVAFQKSDIHSLINSTNDHSAFVGLYLLLVSGVLMAIATIIGYIGAIKESKGLLIVYFYSIAFLLILEIAGVALCFTKYQHLRTLYYFREVQVHKKCCGWDGPSDYTLFVPPSCRKRSHGVFIISTDNHPDPDTGMETNSELGTGERARALPAASVTPVSSMSTSTSTSTSTSSTLATTTTTTQGAAAPTTVAAAPPTVAAAPTTVAAVPPTVAIVALSPTTGISQTTTIAALVASPTTAAVTTTTEPTPPTPTTTATANKTAGLTSPVTSVPPMYSTRPVAPNSTHITRAPVVYRNYYQEGCKTKIRPMFIVPAGIGITTMILQLLGMIFSCALLAEIKRGYGPLA